jgi:hypothetical protein
MRLRLVVPVALSLCLITSAAFAGGAITSGSTVTSNIAGPSYLEDWTFSGTAGQRIIVTAVTTSGTLDTNILLKKPGGGVLETSTQYDRLDWVLTASGTYTIEIQDVGLSHTGGYNMTFLNVTAGPLTSGADADGGAILSSDVKTGTMSGASDVDAFTFTGYANSRIAIDAIETGGASFNTYISLYPPNGGAPVIQTSSNRVDYQLTTTGTWTIVIEDNGDDLPGSYSLSMLNILSGPFTNGGDPDGGPIDSNQIVTGQFQQGGDMDGYTFYAFAGNRVLLNALSTGGTANTTLTLYPPNGAGAVTYTSSGDRMDVQVPVSGTYTVIVEDYNYQNTGSYTLSYMNASAGPYTGGGDNDGGLINSSEIKTGTMSGTCDFDAFTFNGNAGDRVLLAAVETAGASFNTYISLYPPGGGAAIIATTANRTEAQLNASGTWTIVIEDNGDDNPGSYSLSMLNITAGPLTNGSDGNGGAIASNEIKNGSFQGVADMDAYTFNASSGDRIVLWATATGAGPVQNTTITLYPPNGGGAVTYTSGGDRLDTQVPLSGTYTAVVEDYSDLNTGTYTMSYMNVSAGPYTGGGDSDGGAMASADVKTGTTSGVDDADVFTFTGNIGDRILIDAVETGGANYNTYMSLYPPGGGAPIIQTTANRQEAQLGVSGAWKLVIEDNNDDTPGSYALSILNITSGPVTNGGDPDGGPIVSNEIKNGQMQQGIDMDAFTFAGNGGDRVLFTGLATGGTLNTTMTLYPPNGGGALTYTSGGDRMEFGLPYAGTYTAVIEDYGNTNPGNYTFSFINATSGPYTGGGDTDGGAIASSDVKNGTTSGAGDFDVYTFAGNAGNRIAIDLVETGGVGYNTYMSLYPPGGGAALIATPSNRQEAVLTATGTWLIVVEDNGDDNPGNYALSLLNISAGPYTNGGDPDGGPVTSNAIKNGSLQQGVDLDAYTLSATAGSRLVMTGVATSGSANTTLTLYPPGGGGAVGYTSGGDRLDVQVPVTGTYTFVVEDYGNTNPGNYTVSYMNVSAGPYTDGSDANGGPINSNDVVTGTTSGTGDIDGYTFNGTAGKRVVIGCVETGGASYNTTMSLYPPGGGAPLILTPSNRQEAQLNATGTWTILVEDYGDDTPGNYSLSLLNVTDGPYSSGSDTDGGSVTTKGAAFHGTIYAPGDMDGYTFYGVTGQTANITAVVNSGAMDTYITLYPPNGGNAVTATSGDNIAPVLTQDGYYTIVIEDNAQDQTGSYTLTVSNSGGVTAVGATPPAELALHGGVPSPFSQSTRIDYDLPASDHVRLDVYDVSGARIRTLVDQARGAGHFAATWDGRDDAGRRVASGVYYLRMETHAKAQNQKVVLVR